MFFLLKCAFWLWIVFSCMTWPGQQGPETFARETAGALAERAQALAVQQASAYCTQSPASCLEIARRAISTEHAADAGPAERASPEKTSTATSHDAVAQAALPPPRPGRGRLRD